MLAVSLVIGGFVSWFASQAPDGLERVAEDSGFGDAASHPGFEILPDYTVPGLSPFWSNALAGLIGTAVVFGVVVLTGRLLSRRVMARASATRSPRQMLSARVFGCKGVRRCRARPAWRSFGLRLE